MAFVVEDGTGLDNSTAYVTIAQVDEYHTDRGNTGWSGDNSVKEVAIIKATDYIDKRFRKKLIGSKFSEDQALQWPRKDAIDDNGFDVSESIPTTLIKVCSEYALRALIVSNLLPDPELFFSDRNTFESSGSTQSSSEGLGEIKSTSVKVDVIETKTTYQSMSDTFEKLGMSLKTIGDVPGLFIPQYPSADLMMLELLKSSNGGVCRA